MKTFPPTLLSRRKFLQYCQGASAAFFPAGFCHSALLAFDSKEQAVPPEQFQLHPTYRVKPGLDAILKKVHAGFDEFLTEKYYDQVAAILDDWSSQLRQSPLDVTPFAKVLSGDFSGCSFKAAQTQPVQEKAWAKIWEVDYRQETVLAGEAFLEQLRSSLASYSKFLTSEFQVIGIHAKSRTSASERETILLDTLVRFDLVGVGQGFHREQRVGHWQLLWELPSGETPRLRQWQVRDETRARSFAPVFADLTSQAFAGNPAYEAQLIPGTDYWRTVLDRATGIDIYGHNGVSIADVDGDGLDDLYVCQPAGLPNRLFRNRGDGSFEDITESSGVGVLENTACALFADVDNDGRQDLIVVRATGPLLFLNQGGGKFHLKPDAFHFAKPPQGTFTGAAMADYDRDGWLDIYFCLYAYYQGADQYRYPMPYFSAENGPPNFMMRNHRDGTFRDVTKQSGLDVNNTRFTFCCAWSDYNGDNWPDLYVVNDFGRKNLYRNNGNGTFTDVAPEVGVENVGAGMGVSWLDFDNDGRQDIYVADMWTAAGIRVSMQDNFQPNASPETRRFYQRHSMGNSLYQNLSGARFEDVGERSGTSMGRWSWCCDAWDFDHDGYPDLYIANGMISGTTRDDLNSFFWRQVVANSPNEARPSHEYEQAWNAINELIRSDRSWSGFERNVLYLNNGNGTFSDVSGITGTDFVEDSRTFAVADFDQDGRLEVVLKNRNSPQLRYLKNVIPDLPPVISFRLTGSKSNPDAVGAKITVETDSSRQTRFVQIGSGFLAQHTKEVFFGLGPAISIVRASIQWPSGATQELHDLPLNHRIWVAEGQPPSRMEPYKPFSNRVSSAASILPNTPEVLPSHSETWLIIPVPAPEFSVPDLGGRIMTLSASRGRPILLHFWFESTASVEKNLDELERLHSADTQSAVSIMAFNVDTTESGRSLASSYSRYSFAVLQASPDVIGMYNLVYRQLFDRHRDMSVPLSFLIDSSGNVVKVYQGHITQDSVATDIKSIPRNDLERLAKALPFKGLTEAYEYERNHFSLGFEFYERGYFEQGQIFFERALKDDPQSAEAYYGLGSSYLQQQKNAEARRCFERVLQLHPTYPGTLPNAWNNLGILSAREGNVDLAIEQFQHALQIDPEHSIALQNLGSAYRQKKDWPAARQALERSLALNSDDAEANYTLGMVYAQQDDTEHAYQYLRKALATRPAYPEALNNLGILYLRTQRPEQAIESFEQCMRVAPAYDQAYLNLARVYVIEGDRDKAKSILQQLLQRHPDHPQATELIKQLER